MVSVTVIQSFSRAPFVVQKRWKKKTKEKELDPKITQFCTKKVKNQDNNTELDLKITRLRTKKVEISRQKERSLTAKSRNPFATFVPAVPRLLAEEKIALQPSTGNKVAAFKDGASVAAQEGPSSSDGRARGERPKSYFGARNVRVTAAPPPSPPPANKYEPH